jgi:phosphoribosylaminoimidazole-succinocarboxamide synthase
MPTQQITQTDFQFPGQTALHHGKVRDTYTIKDKLLVSIATDRISAFDVILPKAIPHKGQVLNQLAAYFLEKTSDIVPNWLVDVPDPNVSIGHLAEPFKIEMVIRGCLVGAAWRAYQAGKRELCGVPLPEGMKEYDRFPEPIVTPSTKAETGHDEEITADEIITQGLATEAEWDMLVDYTRKLFQRGQEMAVARGLVLADTKYEFGKIGGSILLIDEVHTPDSSRYFYTVGYSAYLSGSSTEPPKHLSKEFLREWLIAHDFMGQPGQAIPPMDDIFVQSISDRYIELFERLSGKSFIRTNDSDPLPRIENHVIKALERL